MYDKIHYKLKKKKLHDIALSWCELYSLKELKQNMRAEKFIDLWLCLYSLFWNSPIKGFYCLIYSKLGSELAYAYAYEINLHGLKFHMIFVHFNYCF